MKTFCVVAQNKIKEALCNGIMLKQANVIKSKTDCISMLNLVAFENDGAVLFEINDKLASEDFGQELYIEGSSLTPINPEQLGLVDTITKKAYNKCVDKETTIVKTASIINSLNEEQQKVFNAEYMIALQAAKKENIKNSSKVAIMTALKKVGV